jgi:pimeloyl-ACP methyl ester carboxylesterase
MIPLKPLSLCGQSGQLAALSCGNPENPGILALHGWLDNAASFVPLAALLNDFHIVSLDFPGHGLSDHRPEGVNYHLTDYVADVGHAVKDLGWQQFHIMGHSLGAGVAMVYAATFPEQIDKLVLIDGLGPITATPDAASGQLRKSIDAGLRLASLASSTARVYDDWQKLISARRQASPISEQGAELLLRRGATDRNGEITLNSDRRLKHPSAIYLTEEVVLHLIKGVEAPTLLLLAREGMVIKRRATERRIAAFRDITVKEVTGQHHVHMDNPELLSEDIQRFLVL